MSQCIRQYLRTLFYYLLAPFTFLLRAVGKGFATVFLPYCVRRMFFITSLYAEILSINTDSLSKKQIHTILDRLNREFSLSKDPQALGIAFYFHRALWQDSLVVNTALQRIHREEFANFCVGFASPWLQYGKQRMYKDTLQLVDVIRGNAELSPYFNDFNAVEENLKQASIN